MSELQPGELPGGGPPEAPRPVLIDRLSVSPVLFAILSLILVFMLYQVVGGVVTLLLFGAVPKTEHTTGFRIMTGAGEIILILIPSLILLRAVTRSPRQFLKLKGASPAAFLVPLVGIFSLQQMLQVYMTFQDRIRFPEPVSSQLQEFRQMIDDLYKQLAGSHTGAELTVVLLVVGLVPAVCEEVLFRGLVQRSFERAWSPLRAAMAGGVLFACYHLNPFTLVPLIVLGCYLGFVAYRADSILVSMTTHFWNNFLACIALYLQVKDDYVVTGNAEEMSTGALLLTFWFFGVIFLISTLYFIKITRQPAAHPVTRV